MWFLLVVFLSGRVVAQPTDPYFHEAREFQGGQPLSSDDQVTATLLEEEKSAQRNSAARVESNFDIWRFGAPWNFLDRSTIGKWMNQQVMVLQDFHDQTVDAMMPTMRSALAMRVDTDFEDDDTQRSLHAMAVGLSPSLMSDLAAKKGLPERANSGVSQDGISWRSAEGILPDGTGTWYSIAMQDKKSGKGATATRETWLYPQNGNLVQLQRRQRFARHAPCAAVATVTLVGAAVCVFCWGRLRYLLATVQQSRVEALPGEHPSPGTAKHSQAEAHPDQADLEEQYIGAAYVPLKGER
eukprot:CAMPEP_0177581518 /NCGR_PEP_ID=MMETSP0419_2-20121207/2191_1 /TAXON_ID=582737 /ORGANISM="Tetraselmis sp., Strain GSL018" /LENGTH=297 /DNA_ID=CAMNT_0019070567 /DNA_START=799 /DNA_END=1692 /DNA_ORIENTATION=-